MFKKISIIGIFLVGAIGTVSWYYWRQFTQLPEWYTTQNYSQVVNLKDPEAIQSARVATDKIQQQIQQAGTNSEVELTLTQQEFNQLIVSSIANTSKGQTFLKAVEGINTEINQNEVKIGAVINTSNIPLENLTAQEKQVLQRTLNTLPMMRDRDVYVSLEGIDIQGNQLQFSEDTKVKLGDVSLTLAEVAETGISLEAVQSTNLNLNGLQVTDIQFKDNQALIQGLVN